MDGVECEISEPFTDLFRVLLTENGGRLHTRISRGLAEAETEARGAIDTKGYQTAALLAVNGALIAGLFMGIPFAIKAALPIAAGNLVVNPDPTSDREVALVTSAVQGARC